MTQTIVQTAIEFYRCLAAGDFVAVGFVSSVLSALAAGGICYGTRDWN